MSVLSQWLPNVVANWSGDNGILMAIGQTLYMTVMTSLFGGLIGFIAGVGLVIMDQGGIAPHPVAYSVLDKVVNLFRSIPFIILLAVISPFTRLIVHTTIGTNAALIPLILGTAPFYARQVQNALVQVDPGVIESAQALGYGTKTIIFQVYLREGLSDLIRASVLTMISVVGLTAMAGAIGAGGLGNIAINVGYLRYQDDVIMVSTLLILIIVFAIQAIGDYFARKTDHR